METQRSRKYGCVAGLNRLPLHQARINGSQKLDAQRLSAFCVGSRAHASSSPRCTRAPRAELSLGAGKSPTVGAFFYFKILRMEVWIWPLVARISLPWIKKGLPE